MSWGLVKILAHRSCFRANIFYLLRDASGGRRFWFLIFAEGCATLYYVLVVFGFLMAHAPRWFARWLCIACGNIAMLALPSRKKIVLRNLRHAFPDRKSEWYEKICRENFSRLMELGLLSICGGFFSKKRIRANFKLSKQYREVIERITGDENGAIILLPHFTSMEAMAFIPEIVDDANLPDIGVIYRPFDNVFLEKFIKNVREKRGLKLISRKSGFFEAGKILKMGGIISLLFDQNAGDSGYRMTFFNRVISSTDLPSLLHQRFKSSVYFLYPRRIGFWKANIVIKRLKFDENDPKTIMFAANKHLENILSGSDGACADWLWAHERWKVAVSDPATQGKNRRNWIAESRKYSGVKGPMKNIRVLVRMPNWLGDVVMAVPILRALKESRDDMELILICQPQFVDLLNALRAADSIIKLPPHGISYFFSFSEVKNLYPDVHISLVNSLRGDIEAALIGAQKRIGMDIKNRFHRKFFINNLYRNYSNIGSVHQTRLWQSMLNKFGFHCEDSLTPFKFCANASRRPMHKYSVGIFCGSVHEMRKRWPVESWKMLIEGIFDKYQGSHINLYGSEADAVFTDEIAVFFNRATISNLAGRTTILELVDYMQRDNLIISIDSGGMHLANMFGCPLICIYGITNPIATGPIFDAHKMIIIPESCPMKGGFPTEDVDSSAVLKAVKLMLR
ncbi:MAG: hypothetical protein LBB18_04400 [Puniceicoccales bacterium]|nr:hypothetical protein [Puniceicoccales bacterium]